jgi:hypothetical protein
MCYAEFRKEVQQINALRLFASSQRALRLNLLTLKNHNRLKMIIMHKEWFKCLVKYSSICAIFLLSSLNTNGQDAVRQTRNSIFLDGSSFLYIGAYSVNYERAVFLTDHFIMLGSVGTGGWYLTTISKSYYGYSMPLSINLLVGSGNNYFETNLGVRFTSFSNQSNKDISPFFPILNLGYRYQRQNGKGLIFRSFIGLSGIGIGVGKAF